MSPNKQLERTVIRHVRAISLCAYGALDSAPLDRSTAALGGTGCIVASPKAVSVRSMTWLIATLGLWALAGCATSQSSDAQRTSAPRGITLKMGGSGGDGYTFTLRNDSRIPFQYRHWTGRGPRPVLSIEKVSADGIQRHDEWPVGVDDLLVTHETLLLPGEQIQFDISSEALHRVGVLYWNEDSSQHVLWSAEVERARGFSLQSE